MCVLHVEDKAENCEDGCLQCERAVKMQEYEDVCLVETVEDEMCDLSVQDAVQMCMDDAVEGCEDVCLVRGNVEEGCEYQEMSVLSGRCNRGL